MARSSNQKLKLLHINKFLLENTDENHGVTAAEIISHLASLGISAERKALYDDIENLRAFGTDILSVKEGGTTRYFVADRCFELSELKMLVDAVQVAKFITDKKSKKLISKLETLTSRHEALGLSRQVIMSERIKSMNESIYYNVDKIHFAITKNKAVTFTYFDYNSEKERVLRHGGRRYRVSPYALNWDDENYYLIAYDEDAGMIKHYRVDKMLSICLTDEARTGKKEFEKIDVSMYSKKVFSMFGGEEMAVTLEFDERLCSVMIDRFGKDVYMRKSERDGKIYAHVKVVTSPNFYGWLFSFGSSAKIAAPQSVSEDFKKYCSDVFRQYE